MSSWFIQRFWQVSAPGGIGSLSGFLFRQVVTTRSPSSNPRSGLQFLCRGAIKPSHWANKLSLCAIKLSHLLESPASALKPPSRYARRGFKGRSSFAPAGPPMLALHTPNPPSSAPMKSTPNYSTVSALLLFAMSSSSSGLRPSLPPKQLKN